MHCNRRHDKRNYVNTLHKKIALTYAINACLSCLLMFKESTYETKIQDGCAIIPTQMQTDGCIIRSGLVILELHSRLYTYFKTRQKTDVTLCQLVNQKIK